MAGSSNTNMSTWEPFSGTISSAWGDDMVVTIDDKLHMTETSNTQTIQGPMVFSNTATFNSDVNMNDGITFTASTAIVKCNNVLWLEGSNVKLYYSSNSNNYIHIQDGTIDLFASTAGTYAIGINLVVSSYTSDMPEFKPYDHEFGLLGTSGRAWKYAYAKEMFDDDGNLVAYDERDDLSIIDGFKPWIKDGKVQRDGKGNPIVDKTPNQQGLME